MLWLAFLGLWKSQGEKLVHFVLWWFGWIRYPCRIHPTLISFLLCSFFGISTSLLFYQTWDLFFCVFCTEWLFFYRQKNKYNKRDSSGVSQPYKKIIDSNTTADSYILTMRSTPRPTPTQQSQTQLYQWNKDSIYTF